MIKIIDGAAGAAGIDSTEWERQPGGDGQLILSRSSDADGRIVDEYVRQLAAELRDYNEERLPTAWLRLRVAMHNGVVSPAVNGYAAPAVVTVSRLLDCEQAREALAADGAQLVQILSAGLFEDVVQTARTTLRPGDFRRIEIAEKEYAGAGWLRVLGMEPAAPAKPEPSAPVGRESMAWTFNGTVNAPHSVFGPAGGSGG